MGSLWPMKKPSFAAQATGAAPSVAAAAPKLMRLRRERRVIGLSSWLHGGAYAFEERVARRTQFLAGRRGPGGVDHDDQPLVFECGHRLSEDAGGLIGAVRTDPPEIAVACRGRRAVLDLHPGRFGSPV